MESLIHLESVVIVSACQLPRQSIFHQGRESTRESSTALEVHAQLSGHLWWGLRHTDLRYWCLLIWLADAHPLRRSTPFCRCGTLWQQTRRSASHGRSYLCCCSTLWPVPYSQTLTNRCWCLQFRFKFFNKLIINDVIVNKTIDCNTLYMISNLYWVFDV